MKINEINAKGIITKSNLPDADFVINHILVVNMDAFIVMLIL